MYDVSQGNAVINIEATKEFIRRMAVMGLNMLMMYCEDSFTVDSQPYFGYMRGAYLTNNIALRTVLTQWMLHYRKAM